ncbi:FapA family protein [Pseudoalteromonas denitrificans]|uniref:Flagellar Assembly Protein A N-terminal region domain-containing protein n=1 Tax=Pseudoalteromonas denitrificans DSM 6059 TaxID=1123010 RepID=A0A1I1EUA0_9GAMM|nr:FapA family protein [Pseudoalteromonas denitrificans]SFB90631.1 hypothetical protein SAMN02745724_00445 [Pseudoalteromonas denitrificans DSM 6059]
MSLFSLNQETKQVQLVQHPVDSGYPASADQLVELIEASEFSEYELDLASIRSLFTNSNTIKAPPYFIAKAVDATITVKIDDTNMTAEATLITAKGGGIANADNMILVLEEAGVKNGINNKAIESFLGRQFECQGGDSYSGIVAHGKRTKDGDDTRFVRLCATAQDRVLSPQTKDDGKVDMRDLGALITVNPGTPLMQRIPPSLGEDGYSVFGDILPAKPGRDFPLQIMDGTALDPKNPDILVADAVGVPVAVSRGMRVDDVVCYNNVDVTTGHIEFDGSVIVSGDVKDGMKIKATGDITVLGFVESAEIISESAVTVIHGVIGRKREEGSDFTCSVQANSNVSIGYSQYSKLNSGQDLMIDKQALHCELSARRLIRVGKGDKPRGKIIGGQIIDALRVETGELGAPSGTKTKIYLAQYWHELREKLNHLSALEKTINSKSNVLKQAKKKAEKIPGAEQKRLYLAKIKASEDQLLTKLKKVYKNRDILRKKLKMLLQTSRLTINELMHPGVELHIAKDNKHFSRIYPPNLLKVTEGKITQTFK